MKKLLSLLSVLTISGTAVPTTIAASPYQKQETIKNSDINYQQTNLKTINRTKRGCGDARNYVKNVEGIDYRWAITDYHTMLFIKIKKESWAKIYNNYEELSTKRFKEYLENFISNMHRDDRVGHDHNTKIFNMLLSKIENINNCYNSLPNGVGLDIVMRKTGELNFIDRQ